MENVSPSFTSCTLLSQTKAERRETMEEEDGDEVSLPSLLSVQLHKAAEISTRSNHTQSLWFKKESAVKGHSTV